MMVRAAVLAGLAAALAMGAPAFGQAEDPGQPASGSAGSGSAGSGSAGSGSAGSGSAGSAAAGSGAGSGASGDKILKLPVDLGAPTVSAAASPSVARLGAHFTLYITATFGAGVEVNLREPLDLGPAFEVRRRLSEDSPGVDGRRTREWQLDVTPWELGDQHIAPIAVTFTAFGRAGQVQTNAVPIKVIGVLGDVVDDPRAVRGLAAPRGLLMADWFWIWIASAAGGAIGVIVGALWLRRRRRRRALRLVGGAIARPRRIDMTGERALERLLAIERSGVLDRDGERKAGYAAMVEVIREYLAARYRIATRDLTSSELVRRLEEGAPANELERRSREDQDETRERDALDLVRDWLDDCDLVKYAGYRATPAEAGKALDDARALIVTTTALRAGAPGRHKEAA